MEIRLAEKNKLIEVLYIIRECSRQLIDKGVKYWNNSLADYNEISLDISDQNVYLIILNNVTIGTVTIKLDTINPKTAIINRLAIVPHFQKKGYAQEILKFAEELAKKNGANVIKGYSPVDDKSLFQLLEENGYVNMGSEGEVPEEFIRIKFEKKI